MTPSFCEGCHFCHQNNNQQLLASCLPKTTLTIRDVTYPNSFRVQLKYTHLCNSYPSMLLFSVRGDNLQNNKITVLIRRNLSDNQSTALIRTEQVHFSCTGTQHRWVLLTEVHNKVSEEATLKSNNSLKSHGTYHSLNWVNSQSNSRRTCPWLTGIELLFH